ncbi:MAG: hypothetical protein HKM88_06145, partial [Halobacteria archaeon]|nr:hypothetical protein [Halobacteria archaeon]
MKRLAGLLGVLVLLGGCSQMQPYTNRVLPPVFEGGQGANDWLGDLHNTRGLTKSELQDVLEAWDEAFRDNPNTNNRLRLALLLTAGDKAVRDRGRARKLLDEINSAALGPGDQELITILQRFLAKHEKDRGEINVLSKQV